MNEKRKTPSFVYGIPYGGNVAIPSSRPRPAQRGDRSTRAISPLIGSYRRVLPWPGGARCPARRHLKPGSLYFGSIRRNEHDLDDHRLSRGSASFELFEAPRETSTDHLFSGPAWRDIDDLGDLRPGSSQLLDDSFERASLACSFHRSTFTPITRSHNISDASARKPRTIR
jgi:hypothetical protein